MPLASNFQSVIEVSVETDFEAAEAISALFSEYSMGGPVVEQLWDGQDRPIVRVKVYLSPQEEPSLHRVQEALWHLGQVYPIGQASVRRLSEDDWLEAWKATFGLQRIGEHIVIKPSWQGYEPREGDVLVELDPGLAFGTGLHPSTRLCLAALETLVEAGARVLDVGTGSGILAIAAAKLGAERVEAIDIDPTALRVAEENALRNGLRQRIGLHRASLCPANHFSHLPADAEDTCGLWNAGGEWDGTFALVTMNILASVIADAASPLAASLADGGHFVVSGILKHQEGLVREALVGAGLVVSDRRAEGDWVALVGGKGDERGKGVRQ
jgi:ribosomal protein L11 methyltransferase